MNSKYLYRRQGAAYRVAALVLTIVLASLRAGAAPTPPEQRVIHQLETNAAADLAGPGFSNRVDRIITAAFLRDLLTGTQYTIPTRGLYLANAVVVGELDLRNARVNHDVRLMGCTFENNLVLDGCEFSKGLWLNGCFFAGAVTAQELTVSRSLSLSEGGTPPPLDARTRQFLLGKLPAGSNAPAWINSTSAWPSCFVGAVNLGLTRVGGKFVAQGAEFYGPAQFNGMKVGGTFWLDRAILHQNANFSYITVGDQFSLQQVRFEHPSRHIDFYQLAVGGMVDLGEAVFRGPASFIQVSVKGNFQAYRTLFLNTNNLAADSASTFHHNADFGSLRVDGFAFFLGTRFDGEVSFRNARFQSLYLDEVSWPTNLARENPVRLEWMRYERIQATSSFTNAENDRSDLHWHESHVQTWQNLKTMLATRSPYSADVYASLEAYFEREGESGLAAEVFVESKERERTKVLAQQMPPHRWEWKAAVLWLWNVFLKIMVGHGRHPERALYFSLGFILFGCWAFRFANMKHEKEDKPNEMRAAQTRLEKFLESIKVRSRLQKYHAFWYSLDAFVPIIDLSINQGWLPKPECRLAWNYLALHRLAGAILIPIGFAAFSGIIK